MKKLGHFIMIIYKKEMKQLKKLETLLLGMIVLMIISTATFAQSKNTIYVYGPGGPFPPMNEAAKIFSQKNNVDIIVTKGPTYKWIESAKENGDLIYSGAEFMMQNFIWAMDGKIDENTVQPLYLRPSGLLVRKGNPKKIKGFEDLLKRDLKVLVVNGAGQTALWEDMAGKLGKISTVKALRKKIIYVAHNSAEAKKEWMNNQLIDVWLIWNIWQISNSNIADYVPVSKQYTLYRDCGIAMTIKGETRSIVKKFYEYLMSKEASTIFKKWGWITEQ
jgi:accessory colonization factor AcfC